MQKKRVMRPSWFSRGTEVSRFINEISTGLVINYLEIGLQNGFTFENVRAAKKVGVDPSPLFFKIPNTNVKVFKKTSDTFFLDFDSFLFDIAFIDGLHEFKQSWRDIRNATRVMRGSGLIIVDDVIPSDEYSALVPMQSAFDARILNTGSNSGDWHGDVYKIGVVMSRIQTSIGFATLEGFDNPKMVIWSESGDWNCIKGVGDDFIETFSSLSYVDVFEGIGNSIPPSFRPMNLDLAKSLCIKQLKR